MSIKKTKNNTSIKTMVLTSLMIALTIIMFTTPLGTIPLPIISVTIAILPSIITALTIGLAPSIIVGAAAGLTSLSNALFINPGATLLSPFLINPLVSVLPRILVPIVAFFCFKFIIKLVSNFNIPKYITISIAAIIASSSASLINTIGVLSMLYIIYAAPISEVINGSAAVLLFGIVAANALPEIIINSVIGTIVTLTLFKAKLTKLIST